MRFALEKGFRCVLKARDGIVKSDSLERRRVNGWMVYSLVTSTLFVAGILAQTVLMVPGRQKGIAISERVLKLAGKRDFEGIAAFSSPAVVEFMRQRDEKWGRVVKYSFEDSLVQISGSPAQVWWRVWRERRNVRETFYCINDRVVQAFVSWPEAEEK
ncbi:MAG: hypothetical protein L6Q31_05800 [Fimbriimonadaceae bacterium]|nr:hypothetical protein [Fimbriimonadaceae bacterium]NUM39746.1 hypothetical protein [Armatimonadota bacterium]